MQQIQALLNSDTIFVFGLSFIILFTLLYDILQRMNFFPKSVNVLVSLIICLYVFLTSGYIIINKILSLGTFGLVILFGVLILLIAISRFWKTAKYNSMFTP
ncbi:MAG: hypothetical protein QXM68_01725 [Candidatus Aenigmatarchaeota archaeon]|nr:hypothetical protein [Candidatus Aenigmarchaeota archaeon]